MSGFKNRGEAVRIEFEAAATHIIPPTFDVGEPVIITDRPGVAMTARTAESTEAVIWFGGIFRDIDIINFADMIPGQILYFDKTTNLINSHRITDLDSGTRWGYINESLAVGGGKAEVTVGY